MDGRFLLVPPSTRNTMMGIARFTEQAFVGEGQRRDFQSRAGDFHSVDDRLA